MKKLFALPLAVLFAAACSESTAPRATSAPSLKTAGTAITTATVYSDDFEGISASGATDWNFYNVSSLPSGGTYTAGGSGYLGPFTNQQLTLQYPYISGASLNFDLYIIGTWDGLATHKYGADSYEVSASCGGTEVYSFTTSFSNKRTTHQNYPAVLGGAAYDGRTGSVPNVTLNFASSSTQLVTNKSVSSYDAVYHNAAGLTVPASALSTCVGQTVTFSFGSPSQKLQATSDESWGLDNVVYQ